MEKPKGVGDLFFEGTKYYRNRALNEPQTVFEKPDFYKEYPQAVKVHLDKPETSGGMPIWDSINQRRSERNYTNEPVTSKALSQLLWSIQGITHRMNNSAYRSAPSAGALYPIETYIMANNVDNIDGGVYHYSVLKHELELIENGNRGKAIEKAVLNQKFVLDAAVIFIWSAVFARCKWKYGQRAYRYFPLDAGHIAAHLSLSAVALGLGSCPIAAYYDQEVNDILHIDGEKESVIYITVVGNIK
ncbi:MAG: SagB/ThcOx family dehydrogenase [candidate division Zixibacteria bacterium]|nr:SagB/ThcOx family dehydrogenase [candidate division Zixibacteria bacterium]